jgi:hypothetical protein
MSAVPPIAADLFKLINALAMARHKMPKAHKHELGAQMFNTALNCQRALSSGEYKILSERLATVSSQAAKWHKWAQKNAGSKPAPE